MRAFVNTHQILKTDDRLYVCNTSCDTLGILEDGAMRYLDLNTFEIVDDVEAPTDVNKRDRLHVNSALEHGGDLFLAFTEKSRKLDGAIVCLDRRTFAEKYRIEAGNKLHNITIIGDTLYTLSTGTGELIEIDMNSHAVEIHPLANPAEIYLRGMVDLDGDLLISFSRNFKAQSFMRFSYLKLFRHEREIRHRHFDRQQSRHSEQYAVAGDVAATSPSSAAP